MNLKSILTTFAALAATATLSLAEHPEHKTGKFEGAKANTGYAVHTTDSGPRGLWIVSPEGKRLGLIAGPEQPHSFAWGGEGGRTLYLCAHTSIYRVRLNVEGVQP